MRPGTLVGRSGAPLVCFCAALLLTGAGCRDVTGGTPGGPPAGPLDVLWRTALPTGAEVFLGVPATDGERFYAEVSRQIQAYDAHTGALVWSTPRPLNPPNNLVARGGRVFAAGSVLQALDAPTGRELWRFTPDSTATFGEISADAGAVYVGTASHRVHAVRQADGAALWTVDVGPDWQYRGVVRGTSVSGDTVYVTAERQYSANGYYSAGVVVALDRATGRELWRYQSGTGSESRSVIGAATVAGGLLLASDHKGNAFFAVDRFTGREVWRTPTEPGFAGPEAPPVVADGVAYASGIDAYVYALEPRTGRVVWRTRPAMGGSHQHAVCGSAVFNNLQYLGVVDRQSGRTVKLMFGEKELVSTGFAVSGDRIFLLTDRAAYAVKCP